MVFQVSIDGKEWSECGRAEGREAPQVMDISRWVKGISHFYLRVLIESKTQESQTAIEKLSVYAVEQ